MAALVTACGGGGTSGPADPVPVVGTSTWVVLGSSTAAGVGAPLGQGWVALLQADLAGNGIRVENLAQTGLQTSQAMPAGTALPGGLPVPQPSRNIDAALAREPSVVVLSFPSNDAAARIPAADTVARWQQIAALAASRSAVTVVTGVQPRAAFDAGQRAILAETDRLAAEAFGACHVVVHDALAAPDGTLASEVRSTDGDHLNAEGHARVFARLAAMIESGRCLRLAR